MHRFIPWFQALAILVTCGSGCATDGIRVSYVATRPGVARAAPSPAAVDLWLSSTPDRPYIEQGSIALEQTRAIRPGPISLADMYDRMRLGAAQAGCDAVIMNPPAKQREEWLVSGTCIRYDAAALARRASVTEPARTR